MANKGDIYKVALPNGDEYNFKDKYVRENYRALNNNDFDTINVTDLNSGNIINTGAARFLNTINGSVSGTSSNVTGTVAIANGGTGATTRLGAAQNLTNEAVSNPGYVVGLTSNWGKFGYTTIAQLKTAIGYDTTVTSGSSNLITSGAVAQAIDNLPEPMVFKGTLGTNGTITSLPTASASNEGYTYKVITAGTYASQAAKVGDVFVCAELTSGSYSWVLIPAGDTDSDSWRNIKVNGTEKLTTVISSGAVDFINGINTTVNFNATGNKIQVDAVDTKYGISNSGSSVVLTAGGTGTSVSLDTLLSNLPTWTADPTDDTYFIRQDTSGANQFGRLKFSTMWNYFKGKADSVYAPSSHDHSQIVTVGDKRSTATTPNDYGNKIIFQGLKNSSTIGSPSTDTYSYLIGLRGWTDSSGGNSHELAFNNSGIYRRQGATDTWGSWTKLLDSSNYNDYAPSKTGTGASGTWGISISGTATKATQDGSGREISTTYLPRNSELLTTNPFAPASLQGPYISKIDNALYAANKRWVVTCTNSNNNITALFDGNYDTNLAITEGKTSVITIDFSGGGSGVFPGYPYGYILVSFYYVCKPTSITGRIYCNYEPHGIGWHDITFNPIYDNTTTAMTFRASQTYYGLQKIEITVVGDTTNSYGYTAISQIEFHLTRPLSYNNPFLSKYAAETLYYNLTAPKFIGPLQGNADTATSATSATCLSNNTRMDYGWNGVNYFNFNGTAGNAAKVNDSPTSSYWHIMRYNHGNNTGYYTDLAIPFNNTALYYKRICGGNVQNGGWVQVLDSLHSGYVYNNTIKYYNHDSKFVVNKSTSAWDAQAYSIDGYVDNIMLSFKPNQTNMRMMVGLDSNPSQDASYGNIDYALYCQDDGKVSIYESGTGHPIGSPTYAAGDEFRIEYSGGYVRYYHNGTLLREVARAVSGKLYMDSSFYGATSCIYDVNFGVATRNATYAENAGNATSATTSNQFAENTSYKDSTFIVHTDNSIFKTYLSRYNHLGIDTSNSGGMLVLAGTWSSSAYTSELALGMGDGYGIYYRGKKNGAEQSWQAVGRFTATPTNGQVMITDGTTGGMKSSGYTIATSVPANAVFTDQYVNQSATTTSDWRKIVLSYQSSSSAGTSVIANTNVVYVTANAEIQPSTGTIRTTGNLHVYGNVCANTTNSSTAGGLALYGSSPTDYGIAFRGTGNGGKHGYVQGDWAQYHYMAGADTRGWVFNAGASTGVASISRAGHMVLNGSLTVGGNATNTSGVRQVYNSTTQSLDFVFVA